MANSDGDSSNNSTTHNSDNEQELVKEDLNHKEKINFNGLSAIKSQFENGNLPISTNGNSSSEDNQIVSNGNCGRDEETKKELYKLRSRMCLGRSASMKQVYENQATTTTNGKSSTASIERQRIKLNSMKEKFEKGEFTTENEIEFKERLRREVDEELNVVHEADTAAKDAKNKFKQLEKSNSFQQQSTNKLNNNNNEITPRSTPTHHTKVSSTSSQSTNSPAKKSTAATVTADQQPIEIVKGSEPGQKEEVHINVNQLQERYRFFEQQLNNNNNNNQEEKLIKSPIENTPRRPIQMPKAIDDCIVETPNDQIKRDPNIIRSTDIIDDLPKNDIAKKMLNVFQQLEKSNSITNVTKELNGARERERPPKRCITPPKDFMLDNDETDSTPLNGHDKDIGNLRFFDCDCSPNKCY